jgi:anthranilate/para-aminobenzoate synthase component I
MTDVPEVAVRRIDDLGLEPLAAYGRLRKYTPGRASFLLESLGGDAAAHGRYSIVGYRVKSCALMPPGIDAISVQADTYEGAAAPESFASALAQGSIGFFSSSIASLWQRIRLFEDEGPTGGFALGATVVVFDHHERTVTVAGPARGKVVDRCIWEMQHGEDPAPLASPAEESIPEALHVDVADEKLQARAARARPFLSELESLTLARTFTTPIGSTDGFDCYRALRSSSQSHGYYVDFGESPMTPRLQVFGVGSTVVHARLHGEPGPTLQEGLRASLPHKRAVGAPVADALKLIRQLEDASRQTWGGAIGYVTPGGAASFLLGDEIVAAQHGSFWCTAGVELTEATDPLSVADATRATARTRLAAIALAQRGR